MSKNKNQKKSSLPKTSSVEEFLAAKKAMEPEAITTLEEAVTSDVKEMATDLKVELDENDAVMTTLAMASVDEQEIKADLTPPKKEKKVKASKKGAHLTDQLKSTARGTGHTIEEKSSFFKISGAIKGRNLYIAKAGGRVDLSGFELKHEAVIQISADQAKSKHLGKVRGQLDFDKADALILEAFELALKEMDLVPTTPKIVEPQK